MIPLCLSLHVLLTRFEVGRGDMRWKTKNGKVSGDDLGKMGQDTPGPRPGRWRLV